MAGYTSVTSLGPFYHSMALDARGRRVFAVQSRYRLHGAHCHGDDKANLVDACLKVCGMAWCSNVPKMVSFCDRLVVRSFSKRRVTPLNPIFRLYMDHGMAKHTYFL